MKFLFGVALLCLVGTVYSDSAAVQQCRSLFHVDADSQSTFVNSNCALVCYIHGSPNSHPLNEGLPCPALGNSNYVCRSGACVQNVVNKVGHIDIEVTSAHLAANYNAYSTVCIQNSSVVNQLPIKDRSKCISCSSNLVFSANPVWKAVCANSGKYVFTSDSRVSIEVWNHIATGNNAFLGGASLTISQLLGHGDSHRAISLPLVGGQSTGTVSTIITWTPRN